MGCRMQDAGYRTHGAYGPQDASSPSLRCGRWTLDVDVDVKGPSTRSVAGLESLPGLPPRYRALGRG